MKKEEYTIIERVVLESIRWRVYAENERDGENKKLTDKLRDQGKTEVFIENYLIGYAIGEAEATLRIAEKMIDDEAYKKYDILSCLRIKQYELDALKLSKSIDRIRGINDVHKATDYYED